MGGRVHSRPQYHEGLVEQAERIDPQSTVDILLCNLKHGAVFGHLKQNALHRIHQLRIAEQEPNAYTSVAMDSSRMVYPPPRVLIW